jgi:hypothetical protein
MQPEGQPPICGAKTRSGQPCRTPPMANGRCRLHGGATPRGLASPQFKHGKYSQDLQGLSLAEMYREAREDDELADVRDEIALLEARTRELLRRLGGGEGRAGWVEAAALMSRFRAANQRGDVPRQIECLDALERSLGQGVEDYDLWDEISRTIERRTRLLEAEARRQVQLGQMIPAEKAYLLVTALLDAVRTHVKDQPALSRITEEFRRITGR